MKRKIGILGVLLSAIISLMSCGGGGGDGVPARAPSAKLDGTVTDAVITNGILRVYAFNNGIQGELLGETSTDGSGDFTFDNFTSPSRPIVIEVRDGRYTEEASGVSVQLVDGQVMRAYMFYEQGQPITVQVTPLTHLASCLADYKIDTGTNVNNAITEATSVFSGLAGIDILGTKPLDITDPNNANFEVTDSLRYGTILAAISSFTAEVSVTNGVTPHRFNQNSSIYATQVLCQDISSDGIFNGQGFINSGNSVGQLSLGTVPLDSETFRSTIAQNILSIISSDRNNTSLGIDDFVLYANEVAGSTDAIYGGVPATAVDQEGPVSTAILSPDSFIKGIVDLAFDVTDPIGLKSVQFEVNGVASSNAQVDNPVLSLNTTNYTDGTITITVIAKDVLNNESRTDFDYIIDNTSPTILLTSPLLINNKSYTATGTFEAEGAPITSIMVNGVSASIDDVLGTWTADISLLSGDNIVSIQITDTVGNGNTIEENVAVDLIFPTITPNDTQVTYTTFQGQLNLCNTGQLAPTASISNPVCLSTDNTSLNGTALTGDLQFSGYILLGFTPTDPQGAGVFTGQSDLIVEYKYELNGSEIVPWTTTPKTVSANADLIYYFPMVTEYLGSNWFQTSTTDVHKVTFKVIDLAGNTKELAYQLQFDVLIPEVTVTTSIDDKTLTSTSFASRTVLDGSMVNVSYDFDNPGMTTYLISFDDLENHAVSHIHEIGIRVNEARVKVSEIWMAHNCGSKSWIGCETGVDAPISSISYGSFVRGQGTNESLAGQTRAPSADMFSPYQSVAADTVMVNDITGVPSITPLLDYSCTPGALWMNVGGLYDWAFTAAYANGNTSFPVCRARSINTDKFIEQFSGSVVSTVTQTVQYKPGFPKNNVSETTTDYSMSTEDITVLNNTVGQAVLPINGWYRVLPNTSITIVKEVRLPVILHYLDAELGNLGTFSSYIQKQYDKSTTWSIDTDLTINRVIDPGDINEVNNVTPSISVAGLGIYQATIGR